jgi:hypothetical protein
MKKLWLLAAAVVVVAGGTTTAILVSRARAQRPHAPPPADNPHGKAIDRELSALTAMINAPTGPTPCESAWNALQAGYQTSQKTAHPLVLKLAPRDEFLTRCRALPTAAQPCLALAYSRRHREECVAARVDSKLLEPMFELKPSEGGERDADRQFMSTQRR